MPIRVIHVFEMVEIEEDHAELIAETRRAVDLGFQRLIKMTRVVEAGAIVSDGEFLDLLDGASIIDGDRGVVAQGMQREHFLLAETFHGDS